MTDRELLELAAKAAGIEVRCGTGWESDYLYRDLPRPNSPLTASVRWNPLDDDGDALRLAVKLRINIEYLADMGGKSVGVNCWPRGRGDCGINEDDPDPYAATRRAIVRAAAEIGRAVK